MSSAADNFCIEMKQNIYATHIFVGQANNLNSRFTWYSVWVLIEGKLSSGAFAYPNFVKH